MVKTYLNVNERQVKNNAGGLVYETDLMTRLERFVILGTVGGTFYVSQDNLTKQNLDMVVAAVDKHGTEAVDLILRIGKSNRAPKHDPALVAYAIACSTVDEKVRAYALSRFNEIVRTGTHLFHFLAYIDGRRGWGRALRRAVANWYTSKKETDLAYQLMKYKQRDGWSHRDALRLAHPEAQTPEQNELFRYVTQGTLHAMDHDAHRFVEACEQAAKSEDVEEIVSLIRAYNLPREVLPTESMKDPRVWDALLPHMGMTAMLRNLRNMHKDGYLVQGSDAVRIVVERLGDETALARARIHPAHIYVAMKAASDVPQPVKTALEKAFYTSFGNVTPSNKRIQLALDVSGSMAWAAHMKPHDPSPMEWSALMAMVTARTEPFAEFRAFSHTLIPIDITPTDSIKTIMEKMENIPMGGTDCSLPMVMSEKNNEKFDAFFVYTDNETWYGQNGEYGPWGTPSTGHPMEALKSYRRKSGIHDAKLAVVAITATEFSIADPLDMNTLDVVGFDTSTPAILSDFVR